MQLFKPEFLKCRRAMTIQLTITLIDDYFDNQCE